jgi:hypothetical protein
MPYKTSYGRSSRGGGDGLPAWLVFLLGAALIFGLYYLWQGAQNFLRTGGLGVQESTQVADVVSSATARRDTQVLSEDNRTRVPSATPIPPCQDFVVTVPNAIVREGPSSAAGIVTSYKAGDPVCVISIAPDSEWYLIDMTPSTRRLDAAYMNQTVIRAVNPTPKPTITVTPLPTVTTAPSLTPSATFPVKPTQIPRNTATPTATPTPPPSPTDIRQSA